MFKNLICLMFVFFGCYKVSKKTLDLNEKRIIVIKDLFKCVSKSDTSCISNFIIGGKLNELKLASSFFLPNGLFSNMNVDFKQTNFKVDTSWSPFTYYSINLISKDQKDSMKVKFEFQNFANVYKISDFEIINNILINPVPISLPQPTPSIQSSSKKSTVYSPLKKNSVL